MDLVELQKSRWPPGYDALIKKYGYDPTGMTKFYNHDFQWRQAATRVEWLSRQTIPLLDTSRGLRCLDIGPAAGHFPFLLKQLGHSVHAVEVPDFPAYTDSLELLGIPTTKEFLRANKPLPDVPELQGFDFISVCGIMFDNVPAQEQSYWLWNEWGYLWGTAEWKFLVHDLLSRINPGGWLYLRHNYNWPPGQNMSRVWVMEQPEYCSWLRDNPWIADVSIRLPDVILRKR